jgi:DNA processing protein
VTLIDTIKTVTRRDPRYPEALRRLYRPPAELYVCGNVELLAHENLLAVVGSRKASAYGQQAIKKLLTPIVRAGIPLVSGLAFGIDSIVHRLCLENDGPTIAVLGSGLDDASLYPHQHLKLARQIAAAGGAVVTEYAPGTPALPGQFPVRNRIIAALAQATLVVQAARRSGSLITARLALEQGKDVLAIPGNITDPLAAGTNELIQQGAGPALTAQDILDCLGVTTDFPAEQTKTKELKLSETQQLIIACLSAQPQHVEELAEQTSLPLPAVSATLMELEMLEVAQNVGGLRYVKN